LGDEYLKHLRSMDRHTLEDIMGKYGQKVWNYAYCITKYRSMADDVTQDVFLQVYRHVATFRGESSVLTWLLRITRNISYNYRNTAFFRKVSLVNAIIPKEHGHSAEDAYLEREAANEVWRRVLLLPAKHREVLTLHAHYQLPVEEIALLLKIPAGTVKSRLFAARKKLSSLMKEENDVDEII